MGVRPEHIHLTPDGAPGEVVVVEDLGSEAYIHVKVVSGATDELLVVRVDGETAIERGHIVQLSTPDKVHFFDPSGDRLNDIV